MLSTPRAPLLPRKLSVRRIPNTRVYPNDATAKYPIVELVDDSDEVDSAKFDYVFKIVLVGNSGVGKSNLLSRFVHNIFNAEERATIGVDMMTRHVCVHGPSQQPVIVRLQIWDSAGQERFRALSSVFYRNAAAAVLVYDIADKKSFASLPKWLSDIRKYAEDPTILLLGNKCDLAHISTVPTETGHSYAVDNNLMFSESSAFDRTNVESSFLNMIKKTFIRLEQQAEAQAMQDKLESETNEDDVFDETDSWDLPDEESMEEDSSGDLNTSSSSAASRFVAEPLIKLKRMGAVVLDDIQETSEGRLRKLKRQTSCCKAS
ncbi:ras-related protein rab-11.1-like [Sycon ciliatum]|uniref:ras-related protein rab-11.1-like n=1 Tax=Sycon ciliatum TaxID=27933 RepID=UPI0020AAD9A8|eukprot:scpid69174/ scgid15974/ Ras-related protein Rab-11B; GTP-binding protein YPT3; Ras-related protein Rab-11B; Ras-related protein Rab-11B